MSRTVSITSVQIPVELLTFGMFVSDLDRPWIQTPFLIQGFYVNHPEELTALKDLCRSVWVDISSIPESVKLPPNLPRRTSSARLDKTSPETKNLGNDGNLGAGRKTYPIKRPFEEELPKAATSLDYYSEMVTTTLSELADRKNLDLVKIRQATRPMVESMVANPDAMIWLVRMKSRDDYILKHALCVSMWAVALGRQLGLPKSNLTELSIAGMLADTGKLWVDEQILKKPAALNDEERAEAQKHVEFGLKGLDEASNGHLSPVIRSAILYHHERHMGQGYPEKRYGGAIPLYAKIVGIADYYDAVTSDRSYARAISSGEALKALYQSRDVDFQAELVEEFIQAIGIYPAGSVVELSDGTTAIVVAAGRSHRLHPRVIKILDENQQRTGSKTIIDLAKQNDVPAESRLHIVKSLAADAHKIDLAEFYL